jgi:dihydrofolate reductase/thymidylate synthase
MLVSKDMTATAIVAVSATRSSSPGGGVGGFGIGWKGGLPWNLPSDLKHFARLTKTPPEDSNNNNNNTNKVNAVIMGRNTWNSIPEKFRPLSGRTNVVLTSKPNEILATSSKEVLLASSLEQAWEQLAALDDLGHIFVIGGARVYQQAIEENYVQTVVLSQVQTPPEMEFDTFFPQLDDDEWNLVQEEVPEEPTTKDEFKYSIQTFAKTNVQEEQYLDLIRQILKKGIVKGDRTGTGTKSLFGAQMRFDLRHGQLPLLTTKRTFWRGVAEELLWFIKGSTNANLLQEKGIHIWDGNASKEFLEQRGLGHREEGDLGPVYGFQWRHFGADYVDMHTDYTGQGVDQLADCIDKIKNNPEDRRIIMSAWNPSALEEMALPPCHLLCQFYVDTTANEVSCHMYQRSADMGLGVPFNIASYALLTHLVAHVTGRKAGELVHTLGDAHVYVNHIEPLQEQLDRTPRAFPKLVIQKDTDNIDEITYEDLDVLGYHPYKPISMKMAV